MAQILEGFRRWQERVLKKLEYGLGAEELKKLEADNIDYRNVARRRTKGFEKVD
jgi:hypothetical protein